MAGGMMFLKQLKTVLATIIAITWRLALAAGVVVGFVYVLGEIFDIGFWDAAGWVVVIVMVLSVLAWADSYSPLVD
jgi:acyl-CoA synthetase (NDP forming)